MRLAIGLVATLALVGCTPEESPTPSPSPSVEVESPAPSPSPSPAVESPSPSPSPTAFQSYPVDLPTEDPLSAAIIHGWQEYQRVYEKFATAPNDYSDSDLVETQTVTWGTELRTIVNRIQALRDNDLASEGGAAFRDLTIGSVATNEEGLRTVVLTYCQDLNNFKLRNTTTGETVQRSGKYRESAQMVEGPDAVWRVALIDVESSTC